MSIADLPAFSMLRARMQWGQERQRLLAENIANSDTPNFHARDLAPLDFRDALPRAASVALARTDAGHIAPTASGSGGQFALQRAIRTEVRPGGNAVNLEDEMLKVANNQMEYQAATSLYSRSLGLLKLALARR